MSIEILNLIVLIITCAAVVYYAIVTKQMHGTMVRQTEQIIKQQRLNLLPMLTVHHGDMAQNLIFTNIGNGSALNITIDKLLNAADPQAKVSVTFSPVQHLTVGGTAATASKALYESNSQRQTDQSIIDNPLTGRSQAFPEYKSVTITIRFQDVSGERYVQIITLQRAYDTINAIN